MRISPILIMTLASGLNAKNLPENFYMEESFKKFIREEAGGFYYIEKQINNNFISILEEYDKKNNIISKKESKFINPIDVESYNDYYQLNKITNYKNGKIFNTEYSIGNSNSCFVKCDDEVFYRNSKVLKRVKYPSCFSLFDVEMRKLDYKNSYVVKNCILN